MSKGVVILSGGIDSTTAMAHALVRDQYDLTALSFNYGQKHSRELECAQWQAEAWGVGHHVVDLDFMKDISVLAGSALVDSNVEVPDVQDVMGDPQPVTYVPNRNMIMLSIAASLCEATGGNRVYYGAQRHDIYGYWDTTPTFLANINSVLAENRKTPVLVYAPLVNFSKSDVVSYGLSLGVDYSHTWSCYKGGVRACGVCPTCAERRAAFGKLGLVDPIPYEE